VTAADQSVGSCGK